VHPLPNHCLTGNGCHPTPFSIHPERCNVAPLWPGASGAAPELTTRRVRTPRDDERCESHRGVMLFAIRTAKERYPKRSLPAKASDDLHSLTATTALRRVAP